MNTEQTSKYIFKQEVILKNLKMKLSNYHILCIDQKNLQSNSIKV